MSNDDYFWKCLFAAGVGVGAWELYKRYRAAYPDALEADALKILQQNFNPFSTDDLDRQLKAAAQLEEARIRREHQDLEQRGYPIDKNLEAATLNMLRQNNTLGGNMDDFLAASAEVYQQAKQTALEFSHPDFNRRNGCSYCGGAGWYVCSGCGGSGKNYAVPYPQLSGDRAYDAIILQRYDAACICPGCQGRGQLVCRQCGGTGVA